LSPVKGTNPPRGYLHGVREPENEAMVLTAAHIQPLASLLAGILILIVPQILNYIVAAYLILIGLIGLGLLS
jgi:hypothetical protein